MPTRIADGPNGLKYSPNVLRQPMPIEFDCYSCSKKVRVPDGSEGKKCKCPGCQTVLDVPKAEISPVASKLQIPCPSCDFVLVCNSELEGTRGLCPNCKTIFTIAASGSHSNASQQTELDTIFAFQCPHCQQLFEGKSGMEGRNGKCIHCSQVFEIKKLAEPSQPIPIPKKPEPPTAKRPEIKKKQTVAPVQMQSKGTSNDWLSSIPAPIANVKPYQAPDNPYASTAPSYAASSYLSEPATGDAIAVRKFYLPHESAIKGFALLNAIASGLYLFCAVAAVCFVLYLIVTGLGTGVSLAVIFVYALVYAVLGLLVGLVAQGQYKLNDVGRIGGAIFAVLWLCGIPFGTILGSYLLDLLFSEKGKFVFSERYRATVKQTPNIQPYVPLFVWAILALMLLGLVLMVLAVFAASIRVPARG